MTNAAKTPKLSPQQQQKRVQLFKKLNQAIDDGYASQALTKLNDLKKRFPRDLDVYMTIGRGNAAMGRHPEAIRPTIVNSSVFHWFIAVFLSHYA